MDYDGRRFRPRGEDQPTGVVALYRQQGDLLWGEFLGGQTRRGALTGTCAEDGSIDFAYCMVLATGEVVSGHCGSTPTILDDGRILLRETWERYGEHAATGVSYLEEER